MLVSGFKTPAEIVANPPSFFPRTLTLDAFRNVVLQENVARYLRNSITIAVPVTVVTTVAERDRRLRDEPAALAPGRRRADHVLLLQVFPEALLATPVFIIFKALGLLNTYWPWFSPPRRGRWRLAS